MFLQLAENSDSLNWKKENEETRKEKKSQIEQGKTGERGC